MKTKCNVEQGLPGDSVNCVATGVVNGSVNRVWNPVASNSMESMLDNLVRFYPEEMPVFENEPTRNNFSISFIQDGVGEGVTSLTSFEQGETVFAISGFFSTEVTLFSLQIAEGLHLHDPYFYGKLLHSCDPNTYVDLEKREFIALKPILPSDFVTLDYARTEDYLFRTFPCSCGAANCRGIVAGRKQLQEMGKIS